MLAGGIFRAAPCGSFKGETYRLSIAPITFREVTWLLTLKIGKAEKACEAVQKKLLFNKQIKQNTKNKAFTPTLEGLG